MTSKNRPKLWPQTLEALKKFFFGLAFVLAVGQVFNLNQIVTRDSSPWGVIFAEDNDSAHGIEVLAETKLLNDNGWYSYGPLYYRFAYILKHLDPVLYTQEHKDLRSIKERSLHFALLETSFFALIGIILLFVGLTGGTLFDKLLSTSVYLAILFFNPSWLEFVFRAKPELTNTFFVAAGTWMTVRAMRLPENKRSFWLACFFWGCALACKHLVLIFMPGLLLLWIPPLKRKNLIEATRFFGAIFGFYMLMAYPNSLHIGTHFTKLSTGDIAATHKLGNLMSFIQYLGDFLPSFYILPLLLVTLYLLFISFSAPGPKEKPSAAKHAIPAWRYAAIPIFPFLYLSSRIFLVRTNQYHLPVVASAIVLLLLIARPALQRIAAPWRARVPLLYPIGAALLLIIFATLRPVPKAIAKTYSDRRSCRAEIETMIGKISHAVREDLRVAMDPYVPYSTDATQTKYGTSGKSAQKSGITIDQLNDLDFFATKRSYYSRFIDPAMLDYVLIDYKKTWREIRAFYEILSQGKPFKDLKGKTWVRTYSDECNYEIWERK